VRKHPKTHGPTLKARLGIFAGGLLIALYGLGWLYRGRFSYENYYGQTIFSSSAIVIGLVVALLAFFPPPSVIRKLAFWNRGKRS
jgi:hypothetical protein